MTALGALYHWSPRDRLSGIKRLGLVPGRRNHHGPVYHWDDEGQESKNEYRQDSISFSTSPSLAWDYSHGAWGSSGTFDLWEVHLLPEDEVHVQPMWGDRIVEVRVRNRIKKSRLIWVGERVVYPRKGNSGNCNLELP